MEKQIKKTQKPYKGTALLVLTIINIVLVVGSLIAGIVLWFNGPKTTVIDVDKAKQTVELFPVYAAMIGGACIGIVLTVLTFLARKYCKSKGLLIALGVVSIVLDVTFVQIAMGILTIIHGAKIKKIAAK